MFPPVAIVGRAAVLPGAPDLHAFHEVISQGIDCVGPVPAGRWRMSAEHAMGQGPDRTWCDRGGYVRGFEERFAAELAADPFVLPSEKLLGLDPLFKLVLHTGRAALRDAGHSGSAARVGAIFGNLSYPSASLSQYAEAVWFGGERPDPLNRFMSGMPAHLLATVLGLGGPAYTLDAACASSLYAIKLACDALHDGRADRMLAGAVNRCDDLFIHTGFCALQAMSKSGQSRPFHAEADGLIPAEGAGFLVLERLEDARAAGHRVLGVIRGVGLSNDGRGRGFLAPSAAGQARAMQGAWDQAGLDPATVNLLECHATGTVLGDATELASMGQVFQHEVPIGSLKSNLGHLITAAGVAGVLKVLHGMETGRRFPTLHVEQVNGALQESPFRLLTHGEAWDCEGPRRAGINAFGFGGNNAHLILEEPGAVEPITNPVRSRPIAIVAMGARVGSGTDAAELQRDLQGPPQLPGIAAPIAIQLEGLRFPPKDLKQTRAQQLLLLAAAREAVETGPALPRDRTMVLAGLGCDPEVCRYGARWRLAETLDGPALVEARDRVIEVLESAGVVGNMPNIPANRLNSQFDLAGPSFAVCAEELSGGIALDIARRALAAGEIDAAIVGAVDLSVEPVHTEAIAGLGAPRIGGDAAVVFTLKRLEDAQADGDAILGILDDREAPPFGFDPAQHFGAAHAATALVSLGAALLQGSPTSVQTRSLTGFHHSMSVHPGPDPLPARPNAIGPTITFEPHPPAIAAVKVPMQTMPPAPRLPLSTTTSAAIPVAASATSHAAAPAAAPLARAAMPALPASPQGSGAPADGLRAAQSAMAAAHRLYLEQQASLHTQFMHTRAVAMQSFAHAQGGSFAIPAPSAPALPAPAGPVVRAAVAPVAPVATPSAPVAPAPAKKPAHAGLKSTPDDGSFVLPGPRFDRADLEHLASHVISDRFGPMFALQDDFPRQVRMPEPPLLLADRVTGIDAEPGSMTTGTIWTETDVTPDAWYLHANHMPAGIMIESGQADLLLISWLGADFKNRGERVYRLLGCELTYRGGLPEVGDTLKYDIHVDGHANQGDIRLFFFHYDCRVDGQTRLSVRHGQAGFFTDAELADSGGVLWTPETGEHAADARVDAPRIDCTRSSFTDEQLEAFAHGDAYACFGPGFELTSPHTRTPRIQHGDMRFLKTVSAFEARGGPWGRGYLRAETPISPDDWFFDGHFKDDPCMPGTLMFEGCLQAMAFFMTGLGYTVDKDGWRFEPVPDLPYQLICRGQCIPESRHLIYEVFVEEVHSGPVPMIFADLLCTVDGRKAFHARRVGLQLVPAWPLDEPHPILEDHVETKPVATMEDGFQFDYRSLLACAWGRPSEAFGAPYKVFDGLKKVARLPGPPYHFLSRVTSTNKPFGGFKPGVKIEVEYDVPPDAWYFWENAYPTMPFAVLLEAALQPCGWLASYVGSALSTDVELFFRNLDGTGNLLVEVLPTSGTLRTQVEITAVSASGGMIIEGFNVVCYLGDVAVYEMKTVFGFFPGVALANQLGMPPNDAERKAVVGTDEPIDLRSRPAAYFGGKLRLPEPMLLMCDRITGWNPEGGAKGLGRVLGEKDVNPHEWFFKSHFFQDPVQPGSLGIENLIQVLQWVAIELGLDEGMENPHFEPLMLGRPMTWKYRGQVVPKNKVIRTELDVVEIGEDERGRFVVADGYLWADSLRIYQTIGLGVRVVDGPPAATLGPPPAKTDKDLGLSCRPKKAAPSTSFVLDPAVDTWLQDHRPTWTVPALPAMSMADQLIGASGLKPPVKITDLTIHRWLPVPGPVRLRTVPTEQGGWRLEAWREASRADLSRFEPVCTATIGPAGEPSAIWPPLEGDAAEDPYAAAHLFHGPAFRYLTQLVISEQGSSAILLPASGNVPAGATHQGLLDALTHAIPHDRLNLWFPEIGPDQVAYPYRIPKLEIYGPAPTMPLRVEIRPLPTEDARFPRMAFQAILLDRVWAEGELVEICMPKGPIGSADPLARRAFLEDREWVYQLGLASFSDETATVRASAVTASNWLPGTLEHAYDLRTKNHVEEIAIKDLIGQLACVHPSAVDAERGCLKTTPLTRWPFAVNQRSGSVTVESLGVPDLDTSSIEAWWDERFAVGRWPVEDLYYGLIKRFVGEVHLEDPAATEAIKGRSTLFLANHQVAVESLLFSVLASGLTNVPTVTLAKAEHRHTWLGRMIAHCFSYPGVTDPEVITFFDRDDKASLPRIIGQLAAQMVSPGKSVMVHVEGTRSLTSRTPVEKMSSAFIDMALQTNSPIVPVRFYGALPEEPLEERLEFPVDFARQDIWLGRPLLPEDFAGVPLKERKAMVIDAINALGGPNADEVPSPAPDDDFAARVAAWTQSHPGVDAEHAVLAAVLQDVENPHPETVAILEGRATTPWGKELQRRLNEGL